MKIVNQKTERNYVTVSECTRGSVVQFNKKFHQDYPPNELYLVLDVCGSYSEPRNFDKKSGIANISTGKLSFVEHSREVTVMNAETTVDGPAT